jgi:hypothetical protein
VLYKIYIPSGIDKYWDSKDSSLADLEEEQQQISPIELRSVNFSFTQGEIEQILLTSPYNPNPTFISDTSSQPIYEEDNI